MPRGDGNHAASSSTSMVSSELRGSRGIIPQHRSSSVTASSSPLQLHHQSAPSSSTAQRNTIKLTDINPSITCRLCCGYLIDATTVRECMKSYCRSCIVNHITNTSPYCPSCSEKGEQHKINLDKDDLTLDVKLQNIVYKLVPNLHQREMNRRRSFYVDHPEVDKSCMTAEERGDTRGAPRPEDRISLVLEYGYMKRCTQLDNIENSDTNVPTSSPCVPVASKDCGTSTGLVASTSMACNKLITGSGDMDLNSKRYLLCMAGMPVVLLKKFIAKKYGLIDTDYTVDIMYEDKILDDNWTLIDVSFCHGHVSVYSSLFTSSIPPLLAAFHEALCVHRPDPVTALLFHRTH